MRAEPRLTDLQYKRLDEFISGFEPRASMAMGRDAFGHPEPLRHVWVGSDPEHWACIAWREPNFDARILEATQALGSTSAPWAHGHGALMQLAHHALESRDELSFTNLSFREAHMGLKRRNAFSAPRSRNFSAYFAVEKGSVELAARTLLSEMQGSWIYSCSKLQDGFEHQLDARIGEALSLPSHMEYYHHDHETGFMRPEIQVDGAGHVFAMWIPACARALGAPAKLSVSMVGLGIVLGLGDILGASNRIAQDDPETFRSLFADAILEMEPSDHRQIEARASELRSHFIQVDRRSLIHESAKPSTLSFKPPRL